MIIDSLQKLGLTQNESKIYVATLEAQQLKVSEILQRAGINTGKIYDILEGLVEQGLLSIIIIDDVKHYQAAPPQKIYELIEEQKRQYEKNKALADNILPQLQKKAQQMRPEYQVEVFKGVDGLRAAVERTLPSIKEHDTIYCLGVSTQRSVGVLSVWYQMMNQSIEDKHASFIFSALNKKQAKELESRYPESVKTNTSKLLANIPINVIGEYVLINDYQAEHHILIKSPTAVEGFQKLIKSLLND